ncbi:hypothetical protein ACQPZP_04855 [Spirillospora sp. CA-142024]|uniref:hypothetical protein n=1 Tax=Spirillospora sp. CA-142024 TaxID=3240036 RepID=UPI003D91EC4C
MSTTTVGFRYTGEDAPPGTVCAAVEVIDDALSVAGRILLRAHETTEVELPIGKNLVATGRTPSGDVLQQHFSTDTTGHGDPVVVSMAPPRSDRPAPRGGRRAEVRPRVREWCPAPEQGWVTRNVHLAPILDGISREVANQTPEKLPRWLEMRAPDSEVATLTRLPPGNEAEIAMVNTGTDRPEWVVRLVPGTARTLLAYMHHGNVAGAATIADDHMNRYSWPGASDMPLVDTAVGYFLVRHRREKGAADWVRELARAQPESPDAALLKLRLNLAGSAPDPDTYFRSLRQVIALGLPVLATGLPWLAASLQRGRYSAQGTERPPMVAWDQALDELWRCQSGIRPGLLTSFYIDGTRHLPDDLTLCDLLPLFRTQEEAVPVHWAISRYDSLIGRVHGSVETILSPRRQASLLPLVGDKSADTVGEQTPVAVGLDDPTSTSPESYPADPADLFAMLYDSLPDAIFRDWTATSWYDDQEVRRKANEIAETVLESGVLDPDVTDAFLTERGDLGRFTILLGLDDALAHASPYSTYFNSRALAKPLVNYLTDGTLTGPATPGALLPRCAFPGRPHGRRSKAEFFGVHRIPQAEWERIDHTILSAVHDPHFNRDEPIAVGCAPVLETYDDLEIDFAERDGITVYGMRPMNSAGIRSRIKVIIRRLDESGAQLAVMPQSSLSDALLEHWKEVAFDTAGSDRERHPLRFLLVGSGPLGPSDPPPNRAVLIDRWTGQELLVQDKLSGFPLDAAQMQLWRLPGAPPDKAAEEYSAPGSRISVLDSSLGRLAVLITEDLSRSTEWERELQSCGVSHLLVPSFSKPILPYRWEQQGAERQVAALGTWVTVSNSLAVSAAIPEEELPGNRYTCLVAGPAELSRTRYATSLQFGAASSGDRLGQLQGVGLPHVFPGAAYGAWHERWPHRVAPTEDDQQAAETGTDALAEQIIAKLEKAAANAGDEGRRERLAQTVRWLSGDDREILVKVIDDTMNR